MANAGGPVFQSNVSDEYLITQGGNNASSANTTGDMSGLTFHLFPPGATWTYQQNFFWTPFDPNDKPIKLLVTFDAKTQNALVGRPHYKVPPNFRIDLTCSK